MNYLYFNPRSPSGLRLGRLRCTAFRMPFQSTQPEWAATTQKFKQVLFGLFQSTQPEWAATICKVMPNAFVDISIHAARVGCDRLIRRIDGEGRISIHAARVGCDNISALCLLTELISIHAARVGCDLHIVLQYLHRQNFNPRSPSGLRPSTFSGLRASAYFNPRSPSGLRLPDKWRHSDKKEISIHAARVGCDVVGQGGIGGTLNNFNPRSPSGLRQKGADFLCLKSAFQSTQPEWAATYFVIRKGHRP